jgi:hypothetical protein
VSKGLFAGTVYALPKTLQSGHANVPKVVNGGAPGTITDGTFTTDGAYAVLRNYGSIYILDPKTWSVVHTEESPAEPQGEAITAEASGRSFLVGSEGQNSELIRIPYSRPAPAKPASTPRHGSSTEGSGTSSGVTPRTLAIGAVVALGVLGTGVAVRAKRAR